MVLACSLELKHPGNARTSWTSLQEGARKPDRKSICNMDYRLLFPESWMIIVFFFPVFELLVLSSVFCFIVCFSPRAFSNHFAGPSSVWQIHFHKLGNIPWLYNWYGNGSRVSIKQWLTSSGPGPTWLTTSGILHWRFCKPSICSAMVGKFWKLPGRVCCQTVWPPKFAT